MKIRKKILFIIIPVILIVGLLLLLFKPIQSSQKPKESSPMFSQVSDEDTKRVIENEITIDFGAVTLNKEGNFGYFVEYTLTNNTKFDKWYSLQIDAFDNNNNIIGSGFINIEEIASSETVADRFVIDLESGTQEDLENATLKVTKAYAEIIREGKNKKSDKTKENE